MRYTEEDLAKAKEIIDEMYYAGYIPEEELINLGTVLSNNDIRENGKVIFPSRNAVIRLIIALGYTYQG